MPVAPNNYVPQIAPASAVKRRQALNLWVLLSVFTLGVAALIVAAPLALAGGHEALGRGLYRSFSILCHQLPGRSFHWHGHPFAVCARCTGLYFGLAAGVLAYAVLRPLHSFETPARGWLVLALIPVSVDFLLGYTGLWANTHWSRTLTGGFLGAVIALYLVPGLWDLRVHWRTYFKASPTKEKPLATVTEPALVSAATSDYSAPARRITLDKEKL